MQFKIQYSVFTMTPTLKSVDLYNKKMHCQPKMGHYLPRCKYPLQDKDPCLETKFQSHYNIGFINPLLKNSELYTQGAYFNHLQPQYISERNIMTLLGVESEGRPESEVRRRVGVGLPDTRKRVTGRTWLQLMCCAHSYDQQYVL